MAKVLIVGGAGYVGSSTVAWLIDHGHQVHILDNLSTGHQELALAPMTVAQAGDQSTVSQLCQSHKFDCVMHFAAKSLVGESVLKPKEYYENNVVQTKALLESLIENGVKRFIFSSTCAIFGDPGDRKISEDLPKKPLNPYGENKLEVEGMMSTLAQTHGLQSIALRYFNAAGAEVRLRVGEWHDPETHLIPLIIKAALDEKPIKIFGTDYGTSDGTAIRDYIHVSDLADAHCAAMEKLLQKPKNQGIFEAYNLGSESGFSVKEVIHSTEQTLGKMVKKIEVERRPGDAPRLVADSTRAKKDLKFKCHHELKKIIETAWKWELERRKKLSS